jgi:predicted ATP-grasp superfamily ATP-dependent carboligase
VETPVHFYAERQLRDPILVLCYAGWNDGGDAATTAGRFLLEAFSAQPFAYVDSEEFLDFTVVRPQVRQDEQSGRRIKWPNLELFSIEIESQPFDLLVGLGVEPHLRWKAYTRALLEFVERSGVRMVILLGALLDEVIYSQPVQVSGFAADSELQKRLGFSRSTYEGPTGIVGVLSEAIRETGVETLSLWARLPHYVAQTPYTRASLALLQKLEEITKFPIDLTPLQAKAAEFDQTVSEMIASDPQLSAYVRELKRRAFSQ